MPTNDGLWTLSFCESVVELFSDLKERNDVVSLSDTFQSEMSTLLHTIKVRGNYKAIRKPGLQFMGSDAEVWQCSVW